MSAELARAATAPIQVLIDVDVGLGRTGVGSPEQAAEVARAILAQPNLKLIGVQGYGGAWQHMEGENARAAAVADARPPSPRRRRRTCLTSRTPTYCPSRLNASLSRSPKIVPRNWKKRPSRIGTSRAGRS